MPSGIKVQYSAKMDWGYAMLDTYGCIALHIRLRCPTDAAALALAAISVFCHLEIRRVSVTKG